LDPQSIVLVQKDLVDAVAVRSEVLYPHAMLVDVLKAITDGNYASERLEIWIADGIAHRYALEGLLYSKDGRAPRREDIYRVQYAIALGY
jgi:hypothetical protein